MVAADPTSPAHGVGGWWNESGRPLPGFAVAVAGRGGCG